uniref:hypothetical protein n=1 Tax=Flavobacterium piscinae TaxID=2506424 RepID=UPI002AAB4F98|nr:hypothetical protein [Flavobacterium piscinae]
MYSQANFLFLSGVIAFAQNKNNEIVVELDLVKINNDRVAVKITPPKIKNDETTFFYLKLFREPTLKMIMDDMPKILKPSTIKEMNCLLLKWMKIHG